MDLSERIRKENRDKLRVFQAIVFTYKSSTFFPAAYYYYIGSPWVENRAAGKIFRTPTQADLRFGNMADDEYILNFLFAIQQQSGLDFYY